MNSDQHKEATVTRTERDGKEPNTLLNILRERNLFNNDELRLRNVETGAIGDKKVNVDKAKAIGQTIIKEMKEKKVTDFSFKSSAKHRIKDKP